MTRLGGRYWSGEQTRRVPARLWFEHEAEDMDLTENTRVAESYDQTLTLLYLPAAECVRMLVPDAWCSIRKA